ncbi:filamentous hemagglutinin N-terminal domain-containing protein [Pseudomonas argentinensis]|uniref:Filamentous hemagglutinin n=1 Tax=Phytopseudomonas argentinensis TaxID=289370 RepID=A0A1I3Q1A3_9GAMM|nr:hemagglutinin repeat-containing protein [Pseudomonas argentinensis]KAB0546089.1 filamentous hemagglutinin N-terminal domain-containing protein [Pseudomonas argentinensis]SFJ27623.1 filamentous hemagglutinin [Pseudomonas argentinensis]
MDVRSPFFQNIALIVAGVMFLNPIVTVAAELSIDAQAGGNTTIGQAGNGVPIVNIATPNGSGLSHNKFTDYNVGQQGLILNNGAQAFVPTQQGGYITGNPNLRGGAANVILNEVTGSNRSQLKGYTEVAGQAAHVIVANPHGITCDGCGFINTPRATLSTGAPLVNNGRLQGFDVNDGDIAIEGAGLNASNVDQFDLITRSAQINAEIHAKRLNVIAGRNEVDVATLQATAKADDGSQQPQLAIDSSALGGMYAGAIRLVGTEAGVGVKLAGDMAASAGDIQIDASGQLTTNRMAASNDVTLVAKGVELNADTYAGRNATVTADGKTVVKESLAAGSKVDVGGGELDNQGIVEAGVKADGTLVTNSQLVLNSKRVTNRGELIARGTLDATVDELDNRTGKLISAGDATIQAATLDNRQGQLIGQKNLTLKGGDVTNHAGEVVAAGQLQVDGTALDNQGGTMAANAIDVKLTGALTNDQGLIESTQSLKLDAGSAQNRNGRLRALASTGQSDFQIGSLFDNGQGLVEIGNAVFSLSSGSLTNVGGTVRHVGNQGFDLKLSDLGGAGGRFTTNGEMTLSAADWTNTSELQAERLTLNIGQFTQTATGQLISRQSIVANGDSWLNDGVIATDGTLGLTLTGSYAGNGALRSLGDLTFKAASAEFGTDAQVKSGGVGQFELSGQLLNRGRLTAAQDMSLKLGSLDNLGTLGGAGLLRIEGDALRNEQGLIFSGSDMALRVGALTNYKGDIYSLGALSVAKDESLGQLALLENISGTIESADDMSLAASSLINRKDVFKSTISKISGRMRLTGTDNCKGDHCEASYVVDEVYGLKITEDSARGNLIAGGDLSFIGGDFDNRLSTVSAGGQIDLDTISFRSVGAAGGETRFYDYYVYTKDEDSYYNFVSNIGRYNAYNDPNSSSYNPAAMPLGSIAIGDVRGSRITKTSGGGDVVYSIIQAAGAVNISGAQTLENNLLRPGEKIDQGASRVGQTTVSSDVKPAATLNAQLPPDVKQQAVDPLAQPGFSLPQGQNGLFQISTKPGHRYLIETNPAFADLRNFLNSDYLLSRIGFDPDKAKKRLGDGLYEQRLIRDAVVARTGQRLIAGLDSDEAMYRYLMDNAIASKDALSLVPGVGLSAEQVAALTHDIVWMQEQEVNGEKVLVPVLYLAQASGRLAPTGALIQGSEVSLISGGDLSNKGTLRASGNLKATANNIGNQGLIQAGNRLALLATDSIRNAQGGIINGKDVSLTAVNGDITNERSIGYTEQGGRFTFSNASVDNAARIEAGNNLAVDAGRDLNNLGSVLKAGGDATLSAKRDINLGVVTEVDSSNAQYKKTRVTQSQVTQHGSDVQIAGDLQAKAGRDLLVVGSKVKVGEDVDLAAGRDIAVTSAANESSFQSYRKSGGKTVDIRNQQVRQVASVIEAGGDFTSASGNDTTLIASQVHAGEEAYLYAGGDIDLDAAQNYDYNYYYKKKKGGMFSSSKLKMSESSNSHAVSSYITSGSDLTLRADNDVAARGAQLISDSDIYLRAGGDVVLDAAQNASSQANAKAKSGLFSSKAKSSSSEATTLTGTRLDGQNVVIDAKDDIALRAASLRADDAIVLDAGRDVSVGTAVASQQSSQASKSSSLKWHVFDSLATNGSFTLEQKSKGAQSSSSQEVGSTLSGGTIDVTSGRDTAVRGSTLVADNDIAVAAGRNLVITSGEAKDDSSARSNSKKSGEIGSWWQGATGVVSVKQSSENSTTQQLGSQIASLGGDVDLKAGEAYRQQASQVIAPKGDVSITAKRVDIESGYDLLSSSQKQSYNRTAVGGTVSVPLIDAVQGAKRMTDVAGDTKDGRLTALAAANTAMSGYQAYQSAQTLATGNFAGIKVSVNLSNSQSKSGGTQSGQNVVASSVAAGRDVTIKATGDGDASNLNVVGSTIDAGRNVSLDADGSINLVSAQNTANQKGKNSNSGWSAGVGFGIGQQNGFTIELAANKGRGSSEGEAITHANTLINAGEKVALNSGGDTNLKGAVVTAKQVTGEVGGDLNLASQQDIDNYKSKQQNAGVGLSLCIPPICGGVSTVSGSVSQQKINSEYASVGQQTGIKAGDNGFQIKVVGNTDLKGAIIASNDKAIADGKNSLTTGTLTHSDIENKAEYKGTSISLSGSYSTAAHDKAGNLIKDKDGKPVQEAAANAGTPIALSASGKDKSTTHSGISGGAITITDGAKQQELTGQTAEQAIADVNRDVSSDRDGSNTLKPIFDRKEIEAGFEITEQFVRNVGTFLEQRAAVSTDAKKELAEESAKPAEQRDQVKIAQLQKIIDSNATWEIGGLGRTLVSAISGAAGGNVTGGGSQLLQGAAVSYLQGLAAEKVKGIADELKSETARAALHAIVGCAGATAQSQSCGAGALGGSASVVLNNLIDQLSDQTAEGMTDTQKQNRLNLIGSLVAGITAAAGGEAAVAANAAQIETGNNYLHRPEAQRKATLERRQRAGSLTPDEAIELAEIHRVDEARNQAILDICTNGKKSGGACSALVAQAKLALASYDEPISYSLAWKSVYQEDAANVEKILQGLDSGSITRDAAIAAIAEESGKSWGEIAEQYDTVMAVHSVVAALAGAYGGRGIPSSPKGAGTLVPKETTITPKITIRDHYEHHLNMVDDIKDQLVSQGYTVSQREVSFGSSCGVGRCRPDIIARAPDGSIRIIEVKTGSADLSIRQEKIFPQIENGSSIPRGKVARDFGLIPGKPLKEQGYPNGIPIETKYFPGAKI